VSGPGENGVASLPPPPAPHRRPHHEAFTLAELLALRHALSGCMPDEHYAGARSAFRKVEELLEEVRHG
jgi:hypothetical protein